jgi:hypothetical protein
MKKIYKYILSLALVFVTCFSFLVVPASAVDVNANGMTFWDWIVYETEKSKSGFGSFGGGGCFGSGSGGGRTQTAYNTYVSSVQSALGTSTVGNNCVYLGNWSDCSPQFPEVATYYPHLTFISGAYFSYDTGVCAASYSGSDVSWEVRSTFIVPTSGDYTFTSYFNDVSFRQSSSIVISGGAPVSTDGGGVYSLVAGTTYEYVLTLRCPRKTVGNKYIISGSCRMEYPTGGLASAAGTTDVSTETRIGSLCGDYFYEGDGGKMVQAENVTFFNETNNTYTNPQTGTTTAISRWSYDYATRTYKLYDASGNLVTVAYADSGVTATEGSNTYNYYYGSPTSSGGSGSGSSSSSSGTDPSKETIWDKIGKLFGSLADGVLAVIKSAIGKVLDMLTSIVDMINEKIEKVVTAVLGLFDRIPQLFNGFTAFLSAVFPFLPQEFFDIFILTAALLALIAIIKAIRNR